MIKFRFLENSESMKESIAVLKLWQDKEFNTQQAMRRLCKLNNQDLMSERDFIDVANFWGYKRTD